MLKKIIVKVLRNNNTLSIKLNTNYVVAQIHQCTEKRKLTNVTNVYLYN